LETLQRKGFRITANSGLTASARISRAKFEKVFGTKLTEFRLPEDLSSRCRVRSFYYPPPNSAWHPDPELNGLIDDAYIQWPHYDFGPGTGTAKARVFQIPPQVPPNYLRVPDDVSMLLNALKVHRQGVTGRGVKVAMIDTGFQFDHPYFTERGYQTSRALAAHATQLDSDINGHGTGMAANFLAIAPDASLIGIKYSNEDDPTRDATLHEAIHEALRHQPDIISFSNGFDMRPHDETGLRTSNQQLATLPNSLAGLEVEIANAVASGIVVVCASGDGQVAFPAMMPDVIAVGGAFFDKDHDPSASSDASAFQSKIYPGRSVPDLCGLSGEIANNDQYIMLPVPPGSAIDDALSGVDGTDGKDGWALLGGTSAAAPQVAGVCALLLQTRPKMKPAELKDILERSCTDIEKGSANPASNEGKEMKAGRGRDGATGAGLVDAYQAFQLATT
jgi:subtilisin family serine protease